MSKLRLLLYVSGHGFGHISRSMETLIRILLKKMDWTATVISGRAESFINTLDPKQGWGEVRNRVRFRNAYPDVGIEQKDSLGMDLEATAAKIESFRKERNRFLETEEREIRKEGADILISDSGSLPFVLSKSLGFPSLFLGSFTWDFIYSHYKNEIFTSFAEEIREEYLLCDLGLILPLSCPVDSIPERKEIGLVGRKPLLSRTEARRYFGMEDGVEYFLFSFGAYGIDASKFDWETWNPLGKRIVIGGLEWKVPARNNLGILNLGPCHYPDLLRACDYVLTKPGYGILSEAYYAGTPILYTDRGDFPEYDYLVRELGSKFRSSYLSQRDLLSFRWEQAIHNANSREPEKDPRMERDGVEDVLRQIESI